MDGWSAQNGTNRFVTVGPSKYDRGSGNVGASVKRMWYENFVVEGRVSVWSVEFWTILFAVECCKRGRSECGGGGYGATDPAVRILWKGMTGSTSDDEVKWDRGSTKVRRKESTEAAMTREIRSLVRLNGLEALKCNAFVLQIDDLYGGYEARTVWKLGRPQGCRGRRLCLRWRGSGRHNAVARFSVIL